MVKAKKAKEIVGAYCPFCGTMIFMQPGIKQCSACKAMIGMNVWVDSPPPPKEG